MGATEHTHSCMRLLTVSCKLVSYLSLKLVWSVKMERCAQLVNREPDNKDEPTAGLFASQHIQESIYGNHEILASSPIDDDQIQPASLDLRLGSTAYRIPATFLPGRFSTVADKLNFHTLGLLDLTHGTTLEKNCVYLIPLLEHLRLRELTSGIANPKSSVGRLDVFVQLVADFGVSFDYIPFKYEGPLYLVVVPRSFRLLVRTGSRLAQLRLRRDSARTADPVLVRETDKANLFCNHLDDHGLQHGFLITPDISDENGKVIGYKANKNASDFIDVDRTAAYDKTKYWEVIHAGKTGGVILERDEFYVFPSKETIRVPANYAAELIPYETLVGQFRIHYAKFFDPGFGEPEADGEGSRAVFEIRSHEAPFLLESGQAIGRVVYQRLLARPNRIYGVQIGSSYQRQGLSLSKHFRFPTP